jgi:hypothetical protein
MLGGELRQPRFAAIIQFAEGVLPLFMREECRGLRHRGHSANARASKEEFVPTTLFDQVCGTNDQIA